MVSFILFVRFITILIEIILNSNKCDELADQLNVYSIDIVTTVFIPACIWRGGRFEDIYLAAE